MSVIPKVAHFYWYGDRPLPALRQASVDSFSAMNPDWQVFVHRSGEDPDATFRERVLRSDSSRYGILHRAGGVYFDTDIVFTKPIPEKWLEKDLLLPIDRQTGEIYGVHVLGATPGSEFFRRAMTRVSLRMESKRALGCQSLGVRLWLGCNLYQVAADCYADVTPIPIGSFLAIGAGDVEDCWSPDGEIPGFAIGIHWYGGDRLSGEYEHMEPDQLPDCLVSRALKQCRGVPSG